MSRKHILEDSHSGLVHHLGKVATGKPVRGFESLILRQDNLVSESTHLPKQVVRLGYLKTAD